MGLPRQTVALLAAARQAVQDLSADAVLLLTETRLDWDAVLEHLAGCRLLVAPHDRLLTQDLKEHPGLTVLDINPGPTPTQERMSLALLEAVRSDQLTTGADVVVLYNGIEVEPDRPEHIDSLSVIHLGEHLERLSARDLRKLDTQVPLEVLRAVVDLAIEIGREGREGVPTGALLVIGDTKKVLSMAQPLNFNPFKGYKDHQRDVRDPKVREQIKDFAKLDGAIIIRRDGVAVAGCMLIDAPVTGVINMSMGLGSRHAAAAAISKATEAVAIAVSQSSGAVRIFLDGEVVLHVPPLARPMTFGHFRLETQETDGVGTPAAGRGTASSERSSP